MYPVVLSADDDEDAHFLLRRAFTQAGVRATLQQVNDGAEAIEYLEGRGHFNDREKYPSPNLLLLDLKMPQVSGFGVLEHLRASPLRRDLTVAVFSSSDNPYDVQKARALGCDRYFVKPSDFTALLHIVKSLEIDLLNSTKSHHPSIRLVPGGKLDEVEEKNWTDGPSIRSSIPSDSPEMFSLLVSQVKDYAIYLLDNDGYIRSWNEGARRIKGYEAHEIIGKHFSAFYTRTDIEAEKPAFELRMAREMGNYEEEGWRLRKDGSRFWANVSVTPLRDAQGGQTGFAKVTRDLTQRKFHEEQLQRMLETEERFRLLVEQVKDYAIFFLDAKGNISSWNQGAVRIKGYSADEIIGRHFSIFYTPQDLADDKPGRELSIAIREGRYEEEGWRVKKDGSRFWAAVVITALWDKRCNLTGFAKVTRDMTDRKREEEMLRARTKELEAFAHTLSHDLRAPLRSISSFAGLLMAESESLSAEEKKSYVEKITRSAQGMEMLVRDILNLSQVSLAPAVREPAKLGEVLRDALENLEAEIRDRKARITVRNPMPLLYANRTLLLQIFSNLISNGLKFAKPGNRPEIEISAHRDQNTWTFHVRDQGIGVPAAVQRSIFDPFNRGTAGATFPGTGVGLAIVQKAVDRLGGSISVLSSPEQGGSDFVVTFPGELGVENQPVHSAA